MFLVTIKLVNFVFSLHKKVIYFDPCKKIQHVVLVLVKLKFV